MRHVLEIMYSYSNKYGNHDSDDDFSSTLSGSRSPFPKSASLHCTFVKYIRLLVHPKNCDFHDLHDHVRRRQFIHVS